MVRWAWRIPYLRLNLNWISWMIKPFPQPRCEHTRAAGCVNWWNDGLKKPCSSPFWLQVYKITWKETFSHHVLCQNQHLNTVGCERKTLVGGICGRWLARSQDTCCHVVFTYGFQKSVGLSRVVCILHFLSLCLLVLKSCFSVAT